MYNENFITHPATYIHTNKKYVSLFAYPLITIVIPVHNRESLIAEAISSVIAQTYTNWELIITDDGSTDNTATTVRSFKDERITFLEFPRSGNIPKLRNAGAQYGKGEWICFLDSDDVWLPEKLEIQLSKIQKEKKRWGYAGFELMNANRQTIPLIHGKYNPISGNVIEPLLRYEAAITVISVIIQRDLFEEVGGFDPDLPLTCPNDYEMMLRLALHEETMAIPDILVRIRDHDGRITRSYKNSAERSVLIFKHFLSTCTNKALRKIARRQYAYYLAEAGAVNISTKKYSRGVKQLIKAGLISSSAVLKIIAKSRGHNHKK